jgi:hypothetical protein
MKKKMFCIMILSMFSYNAILAQGPKPPNDPDWKLTNKVFKEMRERLHQCFLRKCRTPVITDGSTNEVYKWILATYKGKATITLVDARYRKEDEERYKKQRGLTDPDAYEVHGYKTKLVKVELTMQAILTDPLYFDCFSICPPPDNGTCPVEDPPVEPTKDKK